MITHYATGDNLDIPLCGKKHVADMFSCGERLVTCPDCRRRKGWSDKAPPMYSIPDRPTVRQQIEKDVRKVFDILEDEGMPISYRQGSAILNVIKEQS